jgi:hypothetical protein
MAHARGGQDMRVRAGGNSVSSLKDLVQTTPDACLLPVPKPSPAGHAAAETHLLGQHSSGDTALENEDDAREHGLVRYPRSTASLALDASVGSRGSTMCHGSSLTDFLLMAASLASAQGFETHSYSVRQVRFRHAARASPR